MDGTEKELMEIIATMERIEAKMDVMMGVTNDTNQRLGRLEQRMDGDEAARQRRLAQ
ncbi:MAG TPA: hypothetical protein VFK33_10860 [Bacillales bacterium]|nr:hypothetical protein [Bacillales bacterium]